MTEPNDIQAIQASALATLAEEQAERERRAAAAAARERNSDFFVHVPVGHTEDTRGDGYTVTTKLAVELGTVVTLARKDLEVADREVRTVRVAVAVNKGGETQAIDVPIRMLDVLIDYLQDARQEAKRWRCRD